VEFANKIAIVTGASSGIGGAVAAALGRKGAAVAAHYARNRDGAERVAREIRAAGGIAQTFPADVRRPDACAALVDAVYERWGAVDIVVNNAGVVDRTPLDAITEAIWDEQMDVHVKGPFFLSRAAAARMPSGGVIVNVSSIRGVMAAAGAPHYAASKAAVTMLTKSLAMAYAPRVRVNAVAPGYTDTPAHAHRTPTSREQIASSIPMGRFATAEEMAAIVCFAASDRSRFMTGQTIVVAGGMAIG
jgi:NAD(P)-dependent dehydrogenase (short-subunit alcohol dehydrogenase family)